MRARGYTPPPQQQYYQQYNPYANNQDYLDESDLHDMADSILDVDQDGDVDFQDVKAVIKRRGVKECQDCGKALKKKSKYGTGVCVDCYRNPPQNKLCKATVASGSRCKRRISSDSEQGYCGIHLKKHEKTQ